jgi:glutamine---fructose-6-phosphate transaminase (isomerizing)
VAHLVEQELRDADGRDLDALAAAVRAATFRLRGSYALAVTANGVGGVVVTRRRSPLLVANTGDALVAASDALGFGSEATDIRELADGDVVALGPAEELRWFDGSGSAVEPPAPIDLRPGQRDVDLDGAPDHTAKEISEEPAVAQRLVAALTGRLADGRLLADLGLEVPTRVRLVACGSSAFAAQATARVLTTVAGLPARVVIASEHADELDEPGMLTIAISQSGETADLLAAREAWGGHWLTFTNRPQSSLARLSDTVLDLDCGPELGVAATKSFVAEVIAGSALALAFGVARGLVRQDRARRLEALLAGVPDRLAATDAMAAPMAARLAAQLAREPGWIYISRGAGVPYAAEGALKLKELAYRWVEMLPAGELKHGPIALVQPGTPVVVVRAEPAARLEVNVEELTARGARIVTVGGHDATLPAELPAQEPPWGPLEAVVALQHLAREVTRRLGNDVDRPRNLAKSVTVE